MSVTSDRGSVSIEYATAGNGPSSPALPTSAATSEQLPRTTRQLEEDEAVVA